MGLSGVVLGQYFGARTGGPATRSHAGQGVTPSARSGGHMLCACWRLWPHHPQTHQPGRRRGVGGYTDRGMLTAALLIFIQDNTQKYKLSLLFFTVISHSYWLVFILTLNI